jgi:hypothetical protein
VVAGTAGAVSHHQQEKYADQAAAQEPQTAEPPPQPAEPTPAAEPDYMAELEQLAQLNKQGVITDEEFEAKKKQLLGI